MNQPPFTFDADPLDAFGQLAGPVHLPSLTTRERDRLLGQLRDWVAHLVTRFAVSPRVIPPCWEQHPGMVEALLALRDHERASYADTASPTAGVDWFRAWHEIEYRLTELAALTQCTTQEHRDPLIQAWAIQRQRGGGSEITQRPSIPHAADGAPAGR